MNKKLKKIILTIILIISIGGIIGAIILAKNDNSNVIGYPNKKNNLSSKYVLIITGFSTVLSLDILYLIMDRNDKFYKNKDKLIIYILGNIVLISSISGITTLS